LNRRIDLLAATGTSLTARRCVLDKQAEEKQRMPIILWLLGVPLSVVLLLWLFNVV
jgi:hypothetical protein